MVAESVCFYLPRQKQATELIRLADLVLIPSRNGDSKSPAKTNGPAAAGETAAP